MLRSVDGNCDLEHKKTGEVSEECSGKVEVNVMEGVDNVSSVGCNHWVRNREHIRGVPSSYLIKEGEGKKQQHEA